MYLRRIKRRKGKNQYNHNFAKRRVSYLLDGHVPVTNICFIIHLSSLNKGKQRIKKKSFTIIHKRQKAHKRRNYQPIET